MEKGLERINKILEQHEKRIKALESKENKKKETISNNDWYRPGSTIDKLMGIKKESFFKKPKSISDIVSELKSKDYHLKAPDLTLPLRKIVRKQILKKTKKMSDGKTSSKWLYVEN